jgi:TOTE conflict system primase-like protein
MPRDDSTIPTDYAALAEQFCDLFAGFQGAHGRCKLNPIIEYKPGTKREAESWTAKTAPTPEIWEEHLSGSGPGIGTAMLLDDGKNVLFGCIDIDVYDKMDLIKLDRLLQARDLPLVVCKSKSGGAHLYLFLKEPAPAADVQAVLTSWLPLLDQPSTREVFPKQTTRGNGEIGNWLNMPFYDCAQPGGIRRPAIIGGTFQGDPIKFLEYARSMQTTLEKIQSMKWSSLSPPSIVQSGRSPMVMGWAMAIGTMNCSGSRDSRSPTGWTTRWHSAYCGRRHRGAIPRTTRPITN